MRRLLNITILATITFACEKLDIVRVDPGIESVQPSAAVPGSNVTITGSNFSEDVSVSFGSNLADVISVENNQLEVRIPTNASEGSIELKIDAQGAPATMNFEVLPFFVEKTPHPDGAYGGAGFVINNTVYFGGGGKEFYKYNPNSDTWTPMEANNSGPQLTGAIGLTVNGKGYILGTGTTKQLWEYDPVTNDWTQKSNYPNNQLIFPATIVIGSNFYLCTGFHDGISNEVWKYSTTNDNWTQESDFAGVKRGDAVGFVINETGYVGQGYDFDTNSFLNDFYVYNATSDSWTEIAAPLQPSANLEGGVGFAIGGKGYIGLGRNGSLAPVKDFWKYDPLDNSWQQFASYPGDGVMVVQPYVVGHKVYLINGANTNFSENYIEMWEFTPETF